VRIKQLPKAYVLNMVTQLNRDLVMHLWVNIYSQVPHLVAFVIQTFGDGAPLEHLAIYLDRFPEALGQIQDHSGSQCYIQQVRNQMSISLNKHRMKHLGMPEFSLLNTINHCIFAKKGIMY